MNLVTRSLLPALLVLGPLVFGEAAAEATADATRYGRFTNDLVVRFTGTGSAELAEKFEFIRPNGEVWSVPKGARVDGASIPRFLWPFVGTPFGGRYARAAVLHDHFAQTGERSLSAANAAFYYACRAAGVPELQAQIMYAAVVVFTPYYIERIGGGRGGGGGEQP